MPKKPSDREEEYIAIKEYKRLKELEKIKHEKLASEEKKKLKELHHMKCPKCGMDLVAIDYKGIEIDKCSGCEGVWLDTGELETVSMFEKSSIDKLFSVFKK